MRLLQSGKIRAILLAGLICGISACGFHLRGATPLAPSLHTLYLKIEDPYSIFARNLKASLLLSHVTLVDTPAAADTILTILQENRNEQLMSVGGTQQTRQYNLTYSIVFEVSNNKGRVLVPAQTATETRSLTLRSSQILGTSNEKDVLYQIMQQAIVFDVMNLLSSHSTVLLLEAPPPVAHQAS